MATAAPDTTSPARYRCTACGNLTRFDITSTRRTRAFHHYTVGGEFEVEDVEVLAEVIEEVSCRWCGNGASVVAEDGTEETNATAGSDESDPPPPEDVRGTQDGATTSATGG